MSTLETQQIQRQHVAHNNYLKHYMKTINLFPWREQFRETEKRKFIKKQVFVFFFSVLIIFIIHLFILADINDQQYRNHILQEQIDLLTQKIQKIKELEKQRMKVISRIERIQSMQTERYWIVQLFNTLTSTVPEGMLLTNIKRFGKTITLTGKAESNSYISLLIRNIKNSRLFSYPTLGEIKTNPNQIPYKNNFELHMEKN